jgi:hypothetical protein
MKPMPDKFSSLNAAKQKAEKLITIGGIIAAIGLLIILVITPASSSPETVQVLGMIVLGIGVVVAIVGGAQFAKINRTFKSDILVGVMKELMPETTYLPDAGLDPSTVYRTECLKRADRFHSEDLITGIMEDVNFRTSDVVLEERHVQHTKNGTHVYYVAYFTGRIFEFTFNKEFDGYLQVLESGSPLSNRPFKKVAMESIDFNKKFRTFSTSELSAFYVLTPDIMERMMKLEQENPGRISFSFTGAILYIAINNNKNTFELRLFKKIDESMIEEFKKDFLVIKDIIMSLKLNQKIFKKS